MLPQKRNLSVTEPISNSTRLSLKWRPPRSSVVKINYYAHFDVSTGRGRSGIVCRNEKGEMISGSTSFAINALIAEALALREALTLALSLNFPSVLMEADCLILVETCRGNLVRREI